MKLLHQLAGLVGVAFLSCVSAQATPFNFSYTFGDGSVVSGSLDGTANGIYVDNVSNVSLSLGGTPLIGTVFMSQYDGSTFLSGSTVSFDALQNNFFFANSDLANGDFGYDSLFYLSNTLDGTATVFSPSVVAQDSPAVSGNWSLSAAAVPDAAPTIALLTLGLAGLVSLRRKAKPGATVSTGA